MKKIKITFTEEPARTGTVEQREAKARKKSARASVDGIRAALSPDGGGQGNKPVKSSTKDGKKVKP